MSGQSQWVVSVRLSACLSASRQAEWHCLCRHDTANIGDKVSNLPGPEQPGGQRGATPARTERLMAIAVSTRAKTAGDTGRYIANHTTEVCISRNEFRRLVLITRTSTCRDRNTSYNKTQLNDH